MHTDVAEVSQGYIYSARKLRDRPRDLLSAIEFGRIEKVSWGPVIAYIFQVASFPQSQGYVSS